MQVCSQTALASSKKPPCYNEYKVRQPNHYNKEESLKKKGLVRLEPYEENQRAKRAFLTERGKEFVSSYVVRMHFVEEQAWSRMTGEEQKQLTDLTKKYSRLLRQEFRTRTQTNVNSCSSEDL